MIGFSAQAYEYSGRPFGGVRGKLRGSRAALGGSARTSWHLHDQLQLASSRRLIIPTVVSRAANTPAWPAVNAALR